MTGVEAKHTLAVDRNAWFLRFYGWLWGVPAEDVTVCKLFWAYVFAPLALLVFKPLRFVRRRKATGVALRRLESTAGRHPGVGRAVATLGAVSSAGFLAFSLVIGFIHAPIVMGGVVGGLVLFVLLVSWFARSHARVSRLVGALESFGGLLLAGYRGVKSRTCPRLEIRGER